MLRSSATSASAQDSLSARLAGAAQRMATWGLLLVGTVSLLAVAWLLFARAQADLRSAGAMTRVHLLGELENTTTGLLNLSRRTLVRNALVDTEGRAAYLAATLEEHRRSGLGLRTVQLLDHAGQRLASGQALPGDQASEAQVRALAMRAMAEERTLHAVVHTAAGWRLQVACPVLFATTGTVEGVLIGEVALTEVFEHELRHLGADAGQSLHPATRLALLSAGQVVGESQPERRGDMRMAWSLPVITESAQTIESERDLQLSLEASMPWQQALAPALWAALLYAALSALIVATVRRRTDRLVANAVQPLQALRDAARRVTLEGLDDIPQLSEAELQQGGLEVQNLADSLAAMLLRLQQAQVDLEQKVSQRTAELSEAKRRMDSTLASLSDGVYSISLDREQLLYASPPVRALLDLPEDVLPMVRASMAPLLGLSQDHAINRALNEALVHGHASVHYELPERTAGRRCLEDRMTVVRDAAGTPLRIDGILSDITEAVLAQEERERNAAGLQLRDSALASAGNGVLIMALEVGRPGKVMYANPAVARLAGTTVDAFQAMDGESLQGFLVDDQIRGALRQCVSERREVRLSTRLRRRDGELLWCEMSISPMSDWRSARDTVGRQRIWVSHVVMVIDDVTERRRQQELHRRVVESINEVIFQTDTEGHWTYLNPAWTRITGLPIEAALNQPFLSHVVTDDRQRSLALFEPLMLGEREQAQFEARFAAADGGHRWLAMHAQPMRDEDGRRVGFIGTLSDVTERREAEQDLRLRTRAIDASTNGIVLSDARQPGMPVVFVNDGFVRITGYGAEEALGRNCGFLQGDAADQEGVQVLREAIQRREPCRVVLRNFRKNGQPFDNDLSIDPVYDEVTGEVTHFVGVLSDVTERLQGERLLRDQFARLDTIFALSPDGFVSFDGQGRVASANPAFERITGQAVAQVLGLTLAEFERRLDRQVAQRNPPGMALWLDHFAVPVSDDATGRVAGSPQTEVLVLQGPPQRVVVRSQSRCDAPDVSRVMYLRDITEETEVDRMKSEFLSTAAHELRTPMASIRGFSDLLLMRNFDETRTRDVLQTINRQSIWLTNMINELLDLARIEARKGKDFELEVLDLRELLHHGVASLLMPGDERPVELQLPAEPVVVRVDRDKFQHALTNVLSNAYKYSPAGGRIELNLREEVRHGEPRVGVAVRDHGIGMSEAHARRAFERFFRADASGNIPGTGLGLALVKEIIELHGGAVSLDTRLGEGTCVTLWLPLWRGEALLQEMEQGVTDAGR